MKNTDKIRRKLLQDQNIEQAVQHIDTDAEFREMAAALVRDAVITAALGTETSEDAPYYQDPQFEAAMRAALAKGLCEHKHRTAIPPSQSPSAPTLPTLFKGARLAADIDVYLNERGTPAGRLRLGGHAFALKFRGFDVALARQFTTSTRVWRDVLVDGLSKQYRGKEASHPDDWNARACFSSLHDASDLECKSAAVVGNVILLAKWDGANLAELMLIREQDVFHASINNHVSANWSGYRCRII